MPQPGASESTKDLEASEAGIQFRMLYACIVSIAAPPIVRFIVNGSRRRQCPLLAKLGRRRVTQNDP